MVEEMRYDHHDAMEQYFIGIAQASVTKLYYCAKHWDA